MRGGRRRGPPRRAPRNIYTRNQPIVTPNPDEGVRPIPIPNPLDDDRTEVVNRNKNPSWYPKVLRLPTPEKLHFPINDDYSKNTFNAIENIQKLISDKNKELDMVKRLTGVDVELDKKRFLMDEIIPLMKKDRDNLAKEKNLDKHKQMWSPELWSINREIEIMEYEACKEDNNDFLKSFNINYFNGPNLRALNLLNSELSKSKFWNHIRDGMIFTSKDGVRVIVDVKGTIQSCLQKSISNKKIICLVGPKNFLVCLNYPNNSPGADGVLFLLLAASSGWPPAIMRQLEGDGDLSINYQLKKWESRHYSTIKNLVEIEYEDIINIIDSIEIFDIKCDVIISSISKDKIGLLIGKKGKRINKLRDLIRKELDNKNWRVSVQKLE